jgi:hypothetical protein
VNFKSVGYHPVPLYIIIKEDGYIVNTDEVEGIQGIFEEYYTDEYIWKELTKLSKEEDKKDKDINKILKEVGRKDLLLVV